MNADFVEGYSVTRSLAAEIVGLQESTLANWLARHPIAPGGPTGSGRSHSFRLRDLMRIAAVKKLTEANIDAKHASGLIEPYASPYSMLLDGSGFTRFSFEKNGVTPVYNPAAAVSITLNAWALFDEMWPRLRAVIEADQSVYRPERVPAAIAAFESMIAELRSEYFRQRVI